MIDIKESPDQCSGKIVGTETTVSKSWGNIYAVAFGSIGKNWFLGKATNHPEMYYEILAANKDTQDDFTNYLKERNVECIITDFTQILSRCEYFKKHSGKLLYNDPHNNNYDKQKSLSTHADLIAIRTKFFNLCGRYWTDSASDGAVISMYSNRERWKEVLVGLRDVFSHMSINLKSSVIEFANTQKHFFPIPMLLKGNVSDDNDTEEVDLGKGHTENNLEKRAYDLKKKWTSMLRGKFSLEEGYHHGKEILS